MSVNRKISVEHSSKVYLAKEMPALIQQYRANDPEEIALFLSEKAIFLASVSWFVTQILDFFFVVDVLL